MSRSQLMPVANLCRVAVADVQVFDIRIHVSNHFNNKLTVSFFG